MDLHSRWAPAQAPPHELKFVKCGMQRALLALFVCCESQWVEGYGIVWWLGLAAGRGRCAARECMR